MEISEEEIVKQATLQQVRQCSSRIRRIKPENTLEGRLLSYYEQVRQERSGISWLAYLPKDIFMELLRFIAANSWRNPRTKFVPVAIRPGYLDMFRKIISFNAPNSNRQTVAAISHSDRRVKIFSLSSAYHLELCTLIAPCKELHSLQAHAPSGTLFAEFDSRIHVLCAANPHDVVHLSTIDCQRISSDANWAVRTFHVVGDLLYVSLRARLHYYVAIYEWKKSSDTGPINVIQLKREGVSWDDEPLNFAYTGPSEAYTIISKYRIHRAEVYCVRDAKSGHALREIPCPSPIEEGADSALCDGRHLFLAKHKFPVVFGVPLQPGGKRMRFEHEGENTDSVLLSASGDLLLVAVGKFLACGGCIWMWDLSTYTCVRVLRLPNRIGLNIEIAGRFVVTVTGGTLRFWCVPTLPELSMLH